MYKLVIMIEACEDPLILEEAWPGFLHLAEGMPGLVKESTSQVHTVLYGNRDIIKMHELFFETLDDLQFALGSPQGQVTGQTLQKITGGKMTLLISEHKEDNIENIRKYKVVDEQSTSAPESI
jgi:hypothetical protein